MHYNLMNNVVRRRQFTGQIFFLKGCAGRGQTKPVKLDHPFTQQTFTEGHARSRDYRASKTDRIPGLRELID